MKRQTIRLVALCALATIAHAAQRPNIVLILADDLGYGDVHALNTSSKIPTPNLDRLAQEGATFTDAHSPSAVCTPTRYGILTGRYCWRTRLKSGVLDGYGAPLIARERPTLATLLGAAGYHTGIVGKWHLGLSFAKMADGTTLDFTKPVQDNPNTRGFDFSCIIPASLDFPPYVYIRDGIVTSPVVDQPAQSFPRFLRQGPRASDLDMETCLSRLAEEANAYITSRAQSDKPFFLYFPLTAPHKPAWPDAQHRGSTGLGPYADFVAQVDTTIGTVLKTLDDHGLRDNTLVFVTSDNGSYMFRRETGPDHVDDETIQAYRPEHHTANHHFRGTKADIWEAGHRIPFFARWPGHIKPASRVDHTIVLTDFFATLADILDLEVPQGAAEDSYSLKPILLGQAKDFERDPVIHHSVSGMFAIRRGPWKLILGNGSGGRELPRGEAFHRPYQLFYIAEDPSETSDIINARLGVAANLDSAFQFIYANADEATP